MRPPASGILNARRAARAGPLEPVDELRVRAVALPLALGVAALFSHARFGHAIQRMLFGMPLHELGHALTAVGLGYPAFPLPWFTPIAAGRSPVLVGLLLGGAATLVFLGRRDARRSWTVAGAALATTVLLGLTLGPGPARMLFAFGGDAGAMILGTLLMATLFSGESSRFRQGGLRWGLLVIGAAAYSDVASSWVAARLDPAEIPLGQFESGGLSDASVLVETFGWTEQALVARYLVVAGICLAALALLWTARALRPLLQQWRA
jgi:hypothetical protein